MTIEELANTVYNPKGVDVPKDVHFTLNIFKNHYIQGATDQRKIDDSELVDTCLKSYNNGAHDAFVQVYAWLRSHIRYVECMENPYAAKITRMTADQFADFFKQAMED